VKFAAAAISGVARSKNVGCTTGRASEGGLEAESPAGSSCPDRPPTPAPKKTHRVCISAGNGNILRQKWGGHAPPPSPAGDDDAPGLTLHGVVVTCGQLFVVENCVDDWRIALSWRAALQIGVELGVCSVHPLPGTSHYTSWVALHDSATRQQVPVPVDVLLSLPMFLRLYLVSRGMSNVLFYL